MKGPMILAAGIVAVLSLGASQNDPAFAECCPTVECANELGCYGECNVCFSPPCSAVCFASCTMRCKVIGPQGQGCTGGGDYECDIGPPSGPIRFEAREWAVLETITGQGVDSAVAPLAFSSEAFAVYAAERWRQNQDRVRIEDLPPELRVDHFIYLSRSSTPGPGFAFGQLSERFPFPAPAGSGIYFRARAVAGEIAEVDVLYGRHSDWNDEFASFLKTSALWIHSKDNPRQPVEFFGYLGAAGEGPGVLLSISGLREMPDEVATLSDVPPAPTVDWDARLETPCREEIMATLDREATP